MFTLMTHLDIEIGRVTEHGADLLFLVGEVELLDLAVL